ncbi:MAG: MGMT family protein [Bacteroidales bacterium]
MNYNESFFVKVYNVVKQIPPGRVSTYGAIASFIGAKGSARMVGWAMNKSHACADEIPAHRVVNRNGILTGKHHFGGSDTMKQLLESEGVAVANDRIINFNKLYWDPAAEDTRT